MIEVVRYRTKDGQEPFTHWFRGLRDGVAKIRVAARLRQIEASNFGDCKSVGDGITELRIHVGAGYRVYCGQQGATLVILLCAGDKGSQAKDILRAKECWADWKRRRT